MSIVGRVSFVVFAFGIGIGQDFFAVNESTATANLQPGEDYPLPEDGANSGNGISRISETSFRLAEPGSYQVMFCVTTIQTPKLALTLDGEVLDYSVAGRPSGGSQIVGMTIVPTTQPDSVLTLRYPDEESNGEEAVPAENPRIDTTSHLVIIRLS